MSATPSQPKPLRESWTKEEIWKLTGQLPHVYTALTHPLDAHPMLTPGECPEILMGFLKDLIAQQENTETRVKASARYLSIQNSIKETEQSDPTIPKKPFDRFSSLTSALDLIGELIKDETIYTVRFRDPETKGWIAQIITPNEIAATIRRDRFVQARMVAQIVQRMPLQTEERQWRAHLGPVDPQTLQASHLHLRCEKTGAYGQIKIADMEKDQAGPAQEVVADCQAEPVVAVAWPVSDNSMVELRSEAKNFYWSKPSAAPESFRIRPRIGSRNDLQIDFETEDGELIGAANAQHHPDQGSNIAWLRNDGEFSGLPNRLVHDGFAEEVYPTGKSAPVVGLRLIDPELQWETEFLTKQQKTIEKSRKATQELLKVVDLERRRPIVQKMTPHTKTNPPRPDSVAAEREGYRG